MSEGLYIKGCYQVGIALQGFFGHGHMASARSGLKPYHSA